MGYATDTLKEYGGSSSLVSAQFIGVGTENGKIDLQSIKCPSASSAKDKILLMTLYGNGAKKDSYAWARVENDDGEKVFAWSDKEGNYAKNVYFEPGQALWIQNDWEVEGVNTITSSGQVMVEDLQFTLDYGGNSILVGNSTPVEIDLQDMLCPSTSAAKDKILLMTLYGNGAKKDSYAWARVENDDGEKVFAWSDKEGNYAKNVKIAPGQGVWVQNDWEVEKVNYITIPGVELTK